MWVELRKERSSDSMLSTYRPHLQVWLLFKRQSPYDQCYKLTKLFSREQGVPTTTKQNTRNAIFLPAGTMQSRDNSEAFALL